MNNNQKQEILEQISASMDGEDVLPAEFFDEKNLYYKDAHLLWSSQSLIQQALLKSDKAYNLNTDISNILAQIDKEEQINTVYNKPLQIKNTLSDTLQRFKKWFNIALPIGVTVAFMGISIITHNAFNIRDIPSNKYFTAHQNSNVHAYGLANLANLEEDDYIDSNILVK